MIDVNQMRCMACEIIIKMSNAKEPKEEILVQLNLLQNYIKGMIEIVEKEGREGNG